MARHSHPQRAHLPRFSKRVTDNMDKAVQHAWKKSTLNKYYYGVRCFLAFCNTENIPQTFRLPASKYLLCAFAASTISERSGSTISNDLSAIRAWHIFHNAPWKGSTRLQYTIKGAKNMTPSSSQLPQRPPVSHEMLIILSKELDMTDPEDACVYACATTAVYGQARLGELLCRTQSTHDPSSHPSRRDLQMPNTACGSRGLHLPDTKTTGKCGADIHICSQSDATCPNDALNNHLRINSPPSRYPLFCYRDKGGYIALTKNRLLRRCNSIWSKYGLCTFTGHSFRIGGTTMLLLRGVDPLIVKAMGRWSSDTFLCYWRSLEYLAPLHAEFLAPYVAHILPPGKHSAAKF